MAMKARLQGNAGNYRFRGAVWELGSFALRAYVHLIPKVARSHLHRTILSADGMIPFSLFSLFFLIFIKSPYNFTLHYRSPSVWLLRSSALRATFI